MEIFEDLPLTTELKEGLIETIMSKLTAHPAKVRQRLVRVTFTRSNFRLQILAEFELHCYEAEGVEAIKRSLQRGLSMNTKEMPITVSTNLDPCLVSILTFLIQIQLKSSPTFDLFTNSNQHSIAQKFLSKVLAEISDEIQKAKGRLKITKEPSVVAAEGEKEAEPDE